MEIQTVQRLSIPEEVAGQLRSLILRGELAPGDKLPSERELAQKFGTNRNTLREALRTLEAQGLVAVRQGAASEVLDFRESGNLNLIPFLFQETGLAEDIFGVVRDLYLIRREFLVMAAGQAATNAGEKDCERIVALAQKLGDARADTHEVMRLDLEFYRAVVAATGGLAGRWLFNTFAPVYHQVAASAPKGFTFPKEYFQGMDRVTGAICKGDAKLATSRLRKHLEKIDELAFLLLDQITKERKLS